MKSVLDLDAFRQTLPADYQAHMDALHVASNNDLIASIQQDLQMDQSMPAQLPASKPPTAFVRCFKAHDKTTK